MAGKFDGKVALVTGGASGIGQATVLAFAREGARVIVADVNDKGGEETVQKVRENAEGMFIRADVSDAADVERMVKTIVDTYGRLDFAHNNAGIVGNVVPIHEYDMDTWNHVMDVNLKGVWLCMKYEIPPMLQQGGGVIVNTASVGGLVGSAKVGAAYVASKHGVIGLTKTAALTYAQQGIRVNAICPGIIRTPMVTQTHGSSPEIDARLTAAYPMGRMGTPEEIAETVLWLCSDAASFITGQAIAVDGGFVAQ